MPMCRLAAILVLVCAAPAAAQPRLDSLGDILPPGAVARLGTTRLHHEHGEVKALAFSPDGKALASAAPYAGLYLWSTADGRKLRWLPHEFTGLWCPFAFMPDGRQLLAAAGGDIVVWDTQTGKETARLPGKQGEMIVGLALTGGSKTLVTACYDGTVRWWDVATRKETRSWQAWPEERKVAGGQQHFKGFRQAVFAADGTALAVQPMEVVVADACGAGRANDEMRVVVFDSATGKERCQWPAKDLPLMEQPRGSFPLKFAFTPDGKRLALTAGRRSRQLDRGEREAPDLAPEVRLWDVVTGKPVAAVPLGQAPYRFDKVAALAFTPDGGTLAFTGTRGTVGFWSLDDTTTLRELTVRPVSLEGPYATSALAFAPDGKSLAVAIWDSLQLFDPVSGAERVITHGHRGPVGFLSFSADGRRLFTGNGVRIEFPREVITWDTATWTEADRSLLAATVLDDLDAVTPDHRLAVAWKKGPALTFYRLGSGETLGTIDQAGTRGHDGAVYPHVFSPDGRLLLAQTYSPKRGRENKVFAVPSGKLLALWNNDDASLNRALALAPDAGLLATFANDGTVWVIDLATGKRKWRLGEPPGNWDAASSGTALAITADGQRLVTWESATGDLRVWNLASGRLALRLQTRNPGSDMSHRARLAWSPDGRSFAFAPEQKEFPIRLIEAASGQVRRVFGGHKGEVLALLFSPDGRLLVSGSNDATVLVWHAYEGR
jgi:WD40 repeat protein